MSLSVIPITMKAYVTATAISGDNTLYQLVFKKNTVDEETIDGVVAVYTAEDLQIPLLSTQRYYGIYFNPIIDGDNLIFKAAYGGYVYTAIVAADDTNVLNGTEPMMFSNDEVEPRLLPEATSADEGKVPTVQEDGSYALETPSTEDSRLPEPQEGDAGKVPTVQNDLTYSLETPVTEDSRIPTPEVADNGKVLIAQDGAYVLGTISGGGTNIQSSVTVRNHIMRKISVDSTNNNQIGVNTNVD